MRIRLRNSVGTCVSFVAASVASSSAEDVSEDELSSLLSARTVPDDSSSSLIDSSERSGSISALEARLYIEAMVAIIVKSCRGKRTAATSVAALVCNDFWKKCFGDKQAFC